MKKTLVATFIFLIPVLASNVCHCYNNIISGKMCSYLDIHDSLVFVLEDTGGGISHFYPRIYRYMTYGDLDPMRQRIFSDSFFFDPEVYWVIDRIDYANNHYREPYWGNPSKPDTSVLPGEYKTIIRAEVEICVNLDGINDTTSYPIPSNSIPWYVQTYLDPTDSIQSEDESLQTYAESLVANSKFEVQAVSKIMDWMVDNMEYEEGRPNDALSVFNDPQHRADCTGYARLAIAFLRSIGIPARFVTGRTINKKLWIPLAGDDSAGVSFEQDYHAWLEVYYPDDGNWIPYDSRSYYHFVDYHRYREAVGIDLGNKDEWHIGNYPTYRMKTYPPYPQAHWRDTSLSHIDYEWSSLIYIDSLSTPCFLVFSDKISGATDIEEDFESSHQNLNGYYVKQNFPNPFNDETIIEYRIPEAPEKVNLSIYNVLGQKVKNLVNERKNPGIYRIHWYGRNDKDQKVSSGIYFYTIKIGKFTDSKIMVFQK